MFAAVVRTPCQVDGCWEHAIAQRSGDEDEASSTEVLLYALLMVYTWQGEPETLKGWLNEVLKERYVYATRGSSWRPSFHNTSKAYKVLNLAVKAKFKPIMESIAAALTGFGGDGRLRVQPCYYTLNNYLNRLQKKKIGCVPSGRSRRTTFGTDRARGQRQLQDFVADGYH